MLFTLHFPILEFVPIQKTDLLGLDNWRQTLINDGMLNPMINNIGPDDVVEWISHRTLWSHFLNSNQDTMLVVLNIETLSSGLPVKVFDKKLKLKLLLQGACFQNFFNSFAHFAFLIFSL